MKYFFNVKIIIYKELYSMVKIVKNVNTQESRADGGLLASFDWFWGRRKKQI